MLDKRKRQKIKTIKKNEKWMIITKEKKIGNGKEEKR